MKLLVERNDVFKIVVRVYEDKNGDLIATTDESDIPPDAEVETVNFTFRRPTNKDAVDLTSSSVFTDAEGAVRVNVIVMQDKIMRNLLIDWDLKNDEGKTLSLNNSNLDKLNPTISRVASIEAIGRIKI